ncbi:hypothetical protein [Cryobacterium psychrophilum]|uniref:hypothetical protein n=1 Tax=Cryobacterium psychrophilum TaxID=41988 RepID=UPI0010CF6FAA|nr:hypothetical protein [Cryobacterium psychrophilum]TDW31349.1 hypothetical protein EDD25_3157 [Cryobacterium psychrophilum]
MTLGNSQPPLTRRQAREAASALEQQSGAEQPGAEQPGAEQPGAEQPDAEQPDAEQSPTDSEDLHVESAQAESAQAESAQVDATTAPETTTGRKPRPGQKRRGSAAKSAQGATAVADDTVPDATTPNAPVTPDSPRPAAIRPDVDPPMTSFAPRSSGSGAGSAAPKLSPDTTGRTLTRRELRALNAAEAADALEFESEAAEDKIVPAEPASKPTKPASTKPAPTKPAADSSRQVSSNPVSSNPGAAGAAAPDAIDESPDADDAADTNALHPPVGHWSIDKGDDEAPESQRPQSLDDLMSLGLGAGGIPTTTNALILPSTPNHGTTSGPLSNTGEILITGSFDLPRSLGETGQHPNHFDSADVDHMNDQLDDVGQADNAPVSASRAVSTHASTRNVMTPPKKSGVTLPVVLVVSTTALAVSVSALLFVGHLLQIF